MLFKFLIILSISFVSTNIQERHLISILSLSDNLFYNTNEKLHSSINNLFYSLKMSHNFTKKIENEILLQMHNDCNSVAEKIYKIYGKIRKICKQYLNIKTSNSVDKLYRLVGEILQENPSITINNENHNKPRSERRLDDDNYDILRNETEVQNELKNQTKADNDNYDPGNNFKLDNEPNSQILDVNNNELKNDFDKELETKTILDPPNNELDSDINLDYNDDPQKPTHNFTDDDEPLDFVKDFLSKINKLSKEDLTRSPINEKDMDINKQTSPTIQNGPQTTKEWHPWISSEEPDDFTANRRIFNGKSTRIKKYSFVASIHISKEFVCAGSIISKDLIITAASCLHTVYTNNDNQNKITVRFGSDYSSFFGVQRTIREVIFYPKYNPVNLTNNLAILRTNTRIRFSSKKRKIRKIRYDRVPGELSEDVDYVTLLGWGAKSAKSTLTSYHKLAFAKLDVYNTEGCREIYTPYYVSDTNFCAGFVTKGGGACNRDAGGPGIVGGLLTGVVSFGSPECGASDAPTVFTKLGYYADWIDSVIERVPMGKENLTLRNLPTVYPNITVVPMQKNETTVTPSVIQEIFILREILLEMTEYNNSINDLLDHELEGDFNETMFKTTEKVDIFHHPLLNKSLFVFADVEDLTTLSTAKHVDGWLNLVTPTTTTTRNFMEELMKPDDRHPLHTETTATTTQTTLNRIHEMVLQDKTRMVRQGTTPAKIRKYPNKYKPNRIKVDAIQLKIEQNINNPHRINLDTVVPYIRQKINKYKTKTTKFEAPRPKLQQNYHQEKIKLETSLQIQKKYKKGETDTVKHETYRPHRINLVSPYSETKQNINKGNTLIIDLDNPERENRVTQMVKYNNKDIFESNFDTSDTDSSSEAALSIKVDVKDLNNNRGNARPKGIEEKGSIKDTNSQDTFLKPFLKTYVNYLGTKNGRTKPYIGTFKNTKTRLI